MVKPAIFQTTMTMIDQKAVSKVGEQVDRLLGQAERVGGRAEQAAIDVEQPGPEQAGRGEADDHRQEEDRAVDS